MAEHEKSGVATIDATLLQKYAPVIASALVLILPAVDVLSRNPSLTAVLQFLALLVTTATTFRLRAPYKQIVEWVGVVVTAVLPLAITGEVTWANWAVVAVAIAKAGATHLGVALRADDSTNESAPVATISQTVQEPVVTLSAVDRDLIAKVASSVSDYNVQAPGANDVLTKGDGLNVDIAQESTDK